MTERQLEIVVGEISRNVALAIWSEEAALKRSYMEVAGALAAALEERSKNQCNQQSGKKSAFPHPRSLTRMISALLQRKSPEK